MLIVALVAFGLLALLAVAGAIFFFMMRKRNNPDEGAHYGSPYFGGSGPGYDRQGNSFGGGHGRSWAAWETWMTQQAGTRLRRAVMARMTRVAIRLRLAMGLALEAGLSQMNPIRTGVRDL